ncbi:MAG: 2-C-methyl-D-erythritol 4-phosphate cytidylyltransferase [Firmicutes bacterium]|nr:2-C-methyl-D-erythritol 4-phosphate cytidylyltransferase [Bacillota bacterium]
MNYAMIVAAGSGKRMGADRPKQFLELNGRTILSYTIEAFENSPDIDGIVIVTNAENTDYVKNDIAAPFKKVKAVVAGGSERQYSVYNGLCALKDCDVVLIHDGVRPFIGAGCIADITENVRRFGCCVLGVPVKDTIKICDGDGFIESTPDRSLLWQAQTPQAFKYDIIMRAHQKAREDGFLGTDDAMLTERLGYRTKMVRGSYENIKITTPEDMDIGLKILEKVKKERYEL